jgi:hypothetical protein
MGSDGVGHDIIHPMDKFQAACRNAMTVYHASEQLKEDIEFALRDIANYVQNLHITTSTTSD